MSNYTLFIGTKNWSSWSLRAWLALRATGVDFEEVVIRLAQPDTGEAIRTRARADTVPALQIRDGGADLTVFDSLAICETLAERHPEAQLWPPSPAARAQARSIAATMHSGFAALRATLPMEFARRLPTPEPNDQVRDEIARIARFWSEALGQGGAGGFLYGRFSIADCMYAPVVSRFRTYGIALDSPLDAYCGRILDLPAMRDWHAAAQKEVDAGLP
ncbi:MAG: glutathione S-transferase family protein [Rhizomicrobium sp.]